ncbi:hypothetical protein AVEN_146526-1 [Araneus ventricosus]|uniref:Uncharacterized protein n=1 Tax=Araneus ventricosus TaxID=182803 RepID=A0A4Y2TRH5_ARAVE|nr:hypothetical protein AVEN_146526-1 [Araneus ventricosus]
MRTAATSARTKYMQYLESERSKEKTEAKQLKRKALEEEIDFLKQKKRFLQMDIHQTNEKANDFANEAEKLCVEVLNDKHMSQLLIIFHVNLQTYPSEKIIPEVKHLNYTDITNEVKEAITNIEPGENYLWNMVKLASDL